MAKIYVASSWKNTAQPKVVEELRNRGHEVYDFRRPKNRDDHNVWLAVCDRLHLLTAYTFNALTPWDFDRMLSDWVAKERFEEHRQAMSDADTCILLLPCGRSAHCEAGWMAGQGKRVIVVDTTQNACPELMYLLFDAYLPDTDSLYRYAL